MTLQWFVIERDLPALGSLERERLRTAFQVQGRDAPTRSRHSVGDVCDDKTFCFYLARDEAIIRKHAELAGVPVTRIVRVSKIIDPAT
jgi:Protein of unknown function (DUF4242)